MVNVLHRLSKPALINDVDAFTVEHGLEDCRDVFRRGALLAQNPNGYEDIEELTQEDRAAFKFEKEHKWHHPSKLYFIRQF